ncbi:hypothetical protein HDA32_002686 [Spinactinospora alkalitolerans]|uniref:Uncharacterized protein n=1 Tax=Spinactinospora alkalitolerans TaxID=687207 RepID=A0A852TT02_9ACTN|nr:hypothetical protein [Spinactinospora alkalitolerans]
MRIGTSDDRGIVAVEFRTTSPSYWEDCDVRLRDTASWLTWLFAPGAKAPKQLLEQFGYTLHCRLGGEAGRYRLEIGTRPEKDPVIWVDLDECVLSEHGLSTPHADEIRRKRKAAKTGGPAVPAPDASPARPVLPPGLPLLTEGFTVLPRESESRTVADPSAAGFSHVVRADTRSAQGPAPGFPVNVRFSLPISGIVTGAPHRPNGREASRGGDDALGPGRAEARCARPAAPGVPCMDRGTPDRRRARKRRPLVGTAPAALPRRSGVRALR